MDDKMIYVLNFEDIKEIIEMLFDKHELNPTLFAEAFVECAYELNKAKVEEVKKQCEQTSFKRSENV